MSLAALATPAVVLVAVIAALYPETRNEAPGIGLLLGVVAALAVGNPAADRTGKLAKSLLQVCVVLLGFGMDLGVVLRAGAKGFGLALVSIVATMILGAAVGRALGVARVTSTLVSVGTAICGGSAIAAVGAAIGAPSADMAVAMGTVFLLNGIALYLYPILGHAMHLGPDAFGTWAGVGIHDVSSVLGAATAFDPASVGPATAVKLSRALWIVPVTLFVRWQHGRPGGAPVPWFIGGFLLASAARSAAPGLADYAAAPVLVAKVGLAAVLAMIGSTLSLAAIRAVGWRPLVQGVALWLFLSGFALVAALTVG